jgi:hypothetical protein
MGEFIQPEYTTDYTGILDEYSRSGNFKPFERKRFKCSFAPGTNISLNWTHNSKPYSYRRDPGFAWNSSGPLSRIMSNVRTNYYGYNSGVQIPDGTADNMFTEMLETSSLLMGTDTNLAVAILELADLKSLATSILHFRKQKISDGVLGYSFGVAPLIDDVKKAITLISSIRDKIALWNESVESGSVLNAHKSQTVQSGEGEFSVDDTHRAYFGGRYLGVKHNVNYIYNVKVRTHMYYRPTKKIDLDETLAVLLKTLGFDKPAKIVWEMVPFSFVINWFVNVDRMLDSLELNPKLIQYELVSAGKSWVETAKIRQDELSNVGDAFYKTASCIFDYEHYVRIPVSPDAVHAAPSNCKLQFTAEFDTFKAVISSALLDQKLRRS